MNSRIDKIKNKYTKEQTESYLSVLDNLGNLFSEYQSAHREYKSMENNWKIQNHELDNAKRQAKQAEEKVRKNIEMALALISSGANPDLKNKSGITLLTYLCFHDASFLNLEKEIDTLITTHKANINSFGIPLIEVYLQNQEKNDAKNKCHTLERMLTVIEKYNPDLSVNNTNRKKILPRIMDCHGSDAIDVIIRLIELGENVNCVNKNGNTILHFITCYDQDEVKLQRLEKILNGNHGQYIDIDLKNNKGESAMQLAIKSDSPPCVQKIGEFRETKRCKLNSLALDFVLDETNILIQIFNSLNPKFLRTEIGQYLTNIDDNFFLETLIAHQDYARNPEAILFVTNAENLLNEYKTMLGLKSNNSEKIFNDSARQFFKSMNKTIKTDVTYQEQAEKIKDDINTFNLKNKNDEVMKLLSKFNLFKIADGEKDKIVEDENDNLISKKSMKK